MKTTNPIWYALVASLLIVPVASTASTAPIERTVEFPLLDQLFPSQSIHDAWERYPLLSKARRVTVEEEQQGGDKTCSEDTTGLLAGMIPTVHVPSPDDDPGALTEAERLALAQSLIDVENVIPSILPHHQKRGNKADLAKRFENGTDVDFYFDHVPRYKQVLTSWEETRDIVFQKGYTLILLGLQVEHSPIARFTNFLHNESGSHYATCNMYLTPPGAAGFAAHMDWMDVVVVQVSGRKLWRVARESTIYLTTWDKSTMFGDITDETGVQSYQEFIMEPGDVLYVPRGVVHNATNAPLAGEDEEPSLHLTFGLEHEGFTTFEGLMQHGVELFRETTSNIDNGVEITFGDDCVQTGEDGTEDWIILLNMAIFGLARMDCDACLAMRQSVPRHEGWKQVYTQRVRAKANMGTDETLSFEQALSVDLTSMADHLVSDTTLNGTLVLIEALVEELAGYGEDVFSYATRTFREEDVEVEDLECYLGAEIDEKVFLDLVARYATFLVENQQAIMERFVAEEIKASAEFAEEDDGILANKWAHTRFCDKEYPFALRFANHSFDCEEE